MYDLADTDESSLSGSEDGLSRSSSRNKGRSVMGTRRGKKRAIEKKKGGKRQGKKTDVQQRKRGGDVDGFLSSIKTIVLDA